MYRLRGRTRYWDRIGEANVLRSVEVDVHRSTLTATGFAPDAGLVSFVDALQCGVDKSASGKQRFSAGGVGVGPKFFR